MKTWLTLLLITLVLTACMIDTAEVKASQTDTQTQKIEKMVAFLINTQFNDNRGLCREAPNVAPNTYWLSSDNIWAWKALTMANEQGLANAVAAGATAQKIKNSLVAFAVQYGLPTDSSGLPESYCHETVIGNPVQPPYKTNTNITLYNGGYVLKTDIRNGTAMPDWDNYSDLTCYGALSCHWQNNDSVALNYYNRAVGMWNESSQGLKDNGTSGTYSAYKIALLLYTAKLLGQNLPFEQQIIDKLYTQQAQNGGIITDYYANGTSTGDANTETTSIAIIALLTPQPPTAIPWIIIATASGLTIVALLVAILVFKRPFQHFSSRANR